MVNKSVRIGMGQLLVEGGEPERNLERAEKMIKEASQKNCEIILLPECLDLAWTHPSAKTEAQSIGIYISFMKLLLFVSIIEFVSTIPISLGWELVFVKLQPFCFSHPKL